MSLGGLVMSLGGLMSRGRVDVLWEGWCLVSHIYTF